MHVMQRCCVTHAARSTEMPLYELPKNTVDTTAPAHSTMSMSRNIDAKASSFEESLASLLLDLQDAVCRQHEMFANRAETTACQTHGSGRQWAKSTEAVQAKQKIDFRTPSLASTNGGMTRGMQMLEVPTSGNQAASLLTECKYDVPSDNVRDSEVLGGGHGLSPAGGRPGSEGRQGHSPAGGRPGSEGRQGHSPAGGRPGSEGLASSDKPQSWHGVTFTDSRAIDDIANSCAMGKKESQHTKTASHPSDDLPKRSKSLASLSRFGAQRRSCRTHSNLLFFSEGGLKRRVSVRRQLDFIKTSQALVGARSFRSSATSHSMLSKFDYDWLVRCFMNLAVLSNVVVLGFQAESDWIGWVFVDAAYVLVFAFELAYRVWHSGISILKWRDPDWRWNWFDIFLVIMTAADVILAFDNLQSKQPLTDNAFSHVGPLRILRIIRILRIFRLSHIEFFRDLGLMVVGTIGGLRTLMWSLVMITVPVYAVALFFTETLGQSADPGTTMLFSSVKMSMFTTFRCLVLGDCSAADGTPIFLHVLEHLGWGYITVYCLACVSMSFGLFSVIVAIYVESTMAAAKANEALQRQRRFEDHVRLSSKIFELVQYIYHEFKLGPVAPEFLLEEALAAEMDRDTFQRVIRDENVRALLHDCDVPEDDFSQLFDVCDSDGGGLLSLDEVTSGIRKLRGVPSRSDVVWIMLRVQELQDGIQHLHVRLAAMDKARVEELSTSMCVAPSRG